MPDRNARARRQVLVVGLGRFGSAVARELVGLGFEVLGVDADERRVQDIAEVLTHALQADTSSMEALVELGAADFDRAVVGIGTDIEASILTTAALSDLGIADITAKAVTEAHGRILTRVGAHHVVYPEGEMGRRVAHLVGGSVLDWFQVDAEFAIVEATVPESVAGRTLGDAGIRARHGVTVVCVKPRGGTFTYATPETELRRGDIVVVAGTNEACETFASLG